MATDTSRAGIGLRTLLKAASIAPLSPLSPVSISSRSSLNLRALYYAARAGTRIEALPAGPGKVVTLDAEQFA
ncbi:hypothetical protein [Sphingomonas sp.]|uniref:hypothetical protein n=1 Tax=Sphingomonas sp. TaxID=28214 RepID=UPI002ED7AE22